MHKPVALAAILLASLLAGCAGDNGPTTTTTTDRPTWPADTATTFYHFPGALAITDATATQLTGDNVPLPALGAYNSIGHGTFEPNIGVTSTGALFFTSLHRDLMSGTPDQGTHIIRSLDGGLNWTDVGPFLGPLGISRIPNSNDPFLYVDPITDRIYKFDMCLTLSGFCVEFSDDDGATWLAYLVATGEQPALDHQSMAAAPPREPMTTVGYPNVLVFCVNRGPQGGQVGGPWCSTSVDGGIAWTPLVPGWEQGKPPCVGLHGHVHGSRMGYFYRGNPACGGHPAVYRSGDGGFTWTEHILNMTTGSMFHEIDVATDEAGNVYAMWIGDDGLPYVAISQDLGVTWGNATMVAPAGVTATGFLSIAAGAEGRYVAAYIGTDVEDGYDGDQDDAKWSGYLSMATAALAPMPLITTVAVNDPDDPLAEGACGNIRCGGFGDFIDVTIDPSGRPYAAFAHNGHDNTGIVGTVAHGPALRGNLTVLPHMPFSGRAGFAA